jgi:hypothetical protein
MYSLRARSDEGMLVLSGLQSVDNFSGGLLIRLSAFRTKIGHNLVQAVHRDLCAIHKPQHVPTNCRWFAVASRNSAYYFKQ